MAFSEKWNDCSIRYGDLKKQLAADIVAYTEPIRQRIEQFSADRDLLRSVARRGAEMATESAQKTLSEVRHIIGFR